MLPKYKDVSDTRVYDADNQEQRCRARRDAFNAETAGQQQVGDHDQPRGQQLHRRFLIRTDAPDHVVHDDYRGIEDRGAEPQ